MATPIEIAAAGLLREHPTALVCALSSNGLIVPVPQSIQLQGQDTIEGRAMSDAVVAADRGNILDGWGEVARTGVASRAVRLLSSPNRWVTAHVFDLRAGHRVLLCVVVKSDERAGKTDDRDAEVEPAPPRYATLTEDEGARVLGCDDAFTRMFGYPAQELIGNSVLDQIHPDDQARALEGWLAMLSSRRPQNTRMRRRRKDGAWVWVDTTLHNHLNDPDFKHVLVELIDVSAEMAAQEALQEREELLRRLTDAMPDGLLQVDVDRKVVYCNARVHRILRGAPSRDVSLDKLIDTTKDFHGPPTSLAHLFEPLTNESLAICRVALSQVLDDGADEDLEISFCLPSGDLRYALLSIRCLRRQTGEISGAIASVLDITDSVRVRQELERRATSDALTGCHNRASILAGLERELEQTNAERTAIVYIDLDGFKQVNDTLGHAAGDDLLVLVAQRLQAISRHSDEVGRLGGDEFIMLLRDVSPKTAMQAANRICTSLSRTADIAGTLVKLQASVGVAIRGGTPVTADELVTRADHAMYRSKQRRQGVPVADTTELRRVAAESQKSDVLRLSPPSARRAIH